LAASQPPTRISVIQTKRMDPEKAVMASATRSAVVAFWCSDHSRAITRSTLRRVSSAAECGWDGRSGGEGTG